MIKGFVNFPDEFISIDIEGNGYWGEKEEIVELAVINFSNNEIAKYKTWLFKPNYKINKVATQIHGLSNEDVKDCPEFTEKVLEIKSWINELPVVAHNASTDVKLLQKNIPEWKPKDIFDTYKLAKEYLRNEKSYKLSNLIEIAGLQSTISQYISRMDYKRGNLHTALYDSLAAALLFGHIKNIMLDIENLKKRQSPELFD